MGINLKKTSIKKGFEIFELLSTENISCGGHNNELNIYMLKIQNKLFSYDELYDYILTNICEYVFNRKRNIEAKEDYKKAQQLILDALDYLRKSSDKDPGAGGELGEILLYLFLEQHLKAPKLLTKIELKTSSNEYVHGADAIHFKFRKDKKGKTILQIVIGEAKIKNELSDGINEAFISIDEYIKNNNHDFSLIDAHLMNQLLNNKEAEILKKYLFGNGTEEKETVFGIFLGYSIKYTGQTDNNDDYKENVAKSNIEQVKKIIEKIKENIEEYKISNYQFNFYFLPFHNAQKDRKHIIEQLTAKNSKFAWGDIRNG